MGEIRPPLGGPTPLDLHHDVSQFDCGEPALDDWLRHRARKSEGRFARTYVVCEGEHRVAGYFCLVVGAVARTGIPKKLQRNAPDPIPIAIIGRLAVDRAYGGRGLGQDLLQDALRRTLSVSQVIGLAAVLVHAKSDAARAFYLRCAEFLEYPADSRTLFLPIESIAKACG